MDNFIVVDTSSFLRLYAGGALDTLLDQGKTIVLTSTVEGELQGQADAGFPSAKGVMSWVGKSRDTILI